MKDAVWFLRISRPGVRVPSIAPRKTSTHCVLVFLFVCTMEGARTRRRRTAPQAISPVGCCLACGSQWLGMSTVEAVDRKISWLFCFISHGCTVSARSVLSMSDDVGRCIALQSVPFLHQVSSAKRSFAFISGSASFSNSKRAVMEMVGSPPTCCGISCAGRLSPSNCPKYAGKVLLEPNPEPVYNWVRNQL